MRLLHTTDLVLKEFFDNAIPRYAILSHRWEEEEVNLQDFVAIRNMTKPDAGYRKILRCCKYAASCGCDWAWIDTCCIDKTSSAELSEAINSMYRWYRRATVCFVYLSDRDQLKASRWFSRGWTLQELLAPTGPVLLLDRDWRGISTKRRMSDLLADITQVPASLLKGTTDLAEFSVAQKMSWAARRRTSRIEDAAYCLLGIFGVNMPLLYGEGWKAFARLQEEILRVSEDRSIILWHEETELADRYGLCTGLLAPSPACFERCGLQGIEDDFTGTRPYRLTNQGLERLNTLAKSTWIPAAN
ncbi:heterokaryon incompatibility protein-domain-containing protein [Exophiala viscosa]|uniref:heterokaryon incompatibility protein-domain-containing protein n=1 Tax=Exophiala viscosa TaxID=2486360 RepID=UPI00218DB4C2|nr:heterokaryon incompatibility protein-domain-containing protein [Exophiala viscosa]